MPWDSTHGVADGLINTGKNYDPQLERLMTKTNTVQVQLKLTYGFM
jgi:hypothetical protein